MFMCIDYKIKMYPIQVLIFVGFNLRGYRDTFLSTKLLNFICQAIRLCCEIINPQKYLSFPNEVLTINSKLDSDVQLDLNYCEIIYSLQIQVYA